MRVFFWIIGVLAGIFLISLLALNIYLSNERLQDLIMPQLEEAAGREVQVGSMSFSFFRTFPNFGLVANDIFVPDDQGGTLASLDQMVIAVNIIPYFTSNEIRISRLDLKQPEIIYIIHEDGSSNLDELLAHLGQTEEEPAETESMALDMRHIFISNALVIYNDHVNGNRIRLGGIDAQTALLFAERLETSISLDIQNISFDQQDDELINGLSIHFETATGIDFENETITIESGHLNLSGLALTLTGSISDWSQENTMVDLAFRSESEDFQALLDLVPESYEDFIAGIEARGMMSLGGTISGYAGADNIPPFQFIFSVEDGYLRYPDVENAIEEITIDIQATNDLILLERLGALAGTNQVSAFGEVRQPLDDGARFILNFSTDANLATVKDFYPLEEEGIELSGMLSLAAVAEGILNEAKQADFDAEIDLTDGYVKLVDVEEPVSDINIAMLINQNLAQIRSFSARAAGNEMDLTGTVREPFNQELTEFDLFGNLDLDLGTIQRFYPMDEDTLMLRGHLIASGTAGGRLDDIENAEFDANLVLTNGYIHHTSLAWPLEDFELESNTNSNYLDITRASLRGGNNSLSVSGRITDYMANPVLNLNMESSLVLSELEAWYPEMENPYRTAGNITADLQISGPVNYLEDMVLTGQVNMNDVHVSGGELPRPVTDLNAIMTFSEDQAGLEQFTMMMGESDFSVDAVLENYMALAVEPGHTTPAVLTGTYHSRMLNIDELYEADDDVSKDPFPIELPNLITRLEASVDTIMFMGITAANIFGRAETDPETITMPEASMDIFDGTIRGAFVWNIPDPEHTHISFQGSLENLQIESFFEEFQLGGRLKLHEFASGSFSAETDYSTELDVYLSPVIPTTQASGFFGMDGAQIQNHPLQSAISSLTNIEEIQDLSLDNWTANYAIDENILTLENLNITSRDIGLVMDGSHNLLSDSLNFTAQLTLPERFASPLSGLISSQGVEALTQANDGMMAVPFHIGGTSESPRPTLDQSRIEDILTDILRDRVQEEGREAARGLLDRLRN